MSQDFIGKRKAIQVRKDHLCDMCGGPIPIGDKSIYRTGVYDGSFYAVYEHKECYEDYCENAAANDYEYEPYSYEWPARIVERWRENEQAWKLRRKQVKGESE